MKNILILLLLCTVSASSIIAQSTQISGKAIDGDSREELIAANITVYRGGILITGVSTDFEGNYSINIDPGTYDVEISYVGYQTVRITGVIAHSMRNNILNVQLGGGRSVVLDGFWNPQPIIQHQVGIRELELTREELFNEAECRRNGN